MILPRVLIFGQPFNNRHGGGITLSNLFRGWDKDKLAVAATGHVMTHVSTEVCELYYQLGYEEFKWRFPFNIIQKRFKSGVLEPGGGNDIPKSVRKRGSRYFIVNSIFYPAMEWLGLFHSAARLKFSPGFMTWIGDFRPQLLYFQVSSLDTIIFAIQLKQYLGVPAVIHMMDDWPSTISSRGPFRKVWQKRIDREFRTLLGMMDLCLSISDAMSSEYKKRYNQNFHPFHNPIDISVWGKYRRTSYKLRESGIRILYSGRIGPGITDSLIEIAEAVEELYRGGLSVRFHIQSPAADKTVVKRLQNYGCTVINPVAEYTSLPEIYAGADILVIANDFDSKGLSFLRYSMPTKASEYMISGTPVLVYSPDETAVSRFFSDHGCGLCVTEHGTRALISALRLLISDEALRSELGTKAASVATDSFDGEIKRREFKELLTKTACLNIKR
jgi:glycosyltransferase involved in cell wall biosynthesis